jgi:folate-binding protein YgfZ
MNPAQPSILQDVHAAAGGVFRERRGRTVVASYGDTDAEFAAALDGAGLVEIAERGVLEVSGPKRLELLQGLVSNDVAGRRPGQGCRAALMTAKGHLRFLLRLLVDEGVVHIETERDRLDLLERVLEHYRVAAPVRFGATSRVVLALVGVASSQVLKTLGIQIPVSPEDHAHVTLAGQDVLVARAGDLPGGGFVLHVGPEQAEAVWGALRAGGARPVGRDALDARRVEDLTPWYEADITEDNLLHETGLLGELHSPTKGCYVGQEIVARLEARGGNVNKALRRVRLPAPATPGVAVRADGKDVGMLATTAVSPRLGPIALAWIHRSHLAPGTELDVAGTRATVVDDFGQE